MEFSTGYLGAKGNRQLVAPGILPRDETGHGTFIAMAAAGASEVIPNSCGTCHARYVY